MRVKVNDMVAERDLVSVFWTATGTNTSAGMGFPRYRQANHDQRHDPVSLAQWENRGRVERVRYAVCDAPGRIAGCAVAGLGALNRACLPAH